MDNLVPAYRNETVVRMPPSKADRDRQLMRPTGRELAQSYLAIIRCGRPAEGVGREVDGVLRRNLLRAALCGAAVGLAIAPSKAQPKMSRSDAEYQDSPKNGLTCAACGLFRPPRSCEVVEGDISPNGWCKFFDLPD